MIINSNIKRVVYIQPYPDTDALGFFEDAGVEIVNIPISDFA
jgi:dCMP deaminase